MRRRELLIGALGSIIYVACGSDAEKAPPPVVPGPDGGTPIDDGEVPLAPPGPTSAEEDSHRVFPQGVASGDPRPDRVVLWTRIDPSAAGKGADADVDLELVIAKDEALTEIVARVNVTAVASADHTVRVIPTELEAGRFYHYRFELLGVATTQVGRTKTAPDPDADVAVKFVFAACQDYIGRYWHAWRAFLEEKVDVDFVLYLGDYIYESVNDARFQSSTPDREIKLPDGIDTSPKQDGSRLAAGTLADYRTLYKVYRQEALLREVHRLYPFIVTWDDHEFADDCWQDHSTSFNGEDPKNPGKANPGDEKSTARRTAANRAFFEHQPIDVVHRADLEFPFDLKIYRSLRYGKHVELFLTDQRSYRADHLVPEGQGASLAVGKFVDYTSVGSRYFIRKAGFDSREAQAKPSLLGAEQKAWFVDAVKKSTATWKVWGNEVQVYQMCLDLYRLPGVPDSIFGFTPYTVYLNGDQWDGYRSERAEILGDFETAGISNLLVCTGDIHSFYAAELHADFDAPKDKPVGVEFVTAGISSASLKDLIGKFIPEDSVLRFVANAWTGAADQALVDSNAPYLRYADTDSYGFTLMTVDGTKAEATFVQLGSPKDKSYGGVTERHRFAAEAGTNKVKAL
ncbi:MAG: alkaline phosphatase D family protein [Labilithrix sp.]|nr:alkaline phosphatase D family protein [Labilithrix sp.]MCW5810995.1 alkaline phosphatase D family protein [Labilithrix sp.]